MHILRTVGCSVAMLIALTGVTSAEEQTLKFRVIMTKMDGSAFPVAGLEKRVLGAEKFAGFAVFDDGRIAYKTVVLTSDATGDAGKYTGFSTYEFHNGDVLVVGFDGAATSKGSGGDYKVVSGKGAYAGAAGTGNFRAVANPWKDADMYEGSITVLLSGKP
ncbi:MAG: hypothetical protein AAF354_10805 [Pseudomonadota bacterium]